MASRRTRKLRIANSAIVVADFITGNLLAGLVAGVAGNAASNLVGKLDVSPKRPIDDRIARLDEAKSAILESLGAIDELREDASRAREEHANVVSALETALANREDAEQKLESIRKIIAQDVLAFREMAGITDVRKERLIGFFSGVCASVLASALWTWVPVLARKFGLG